MTIAELVTRSLQLAGVVGMNRAPSAAEMNDGVDSLNEMLQAWALGRNGPWTRDPCPDRC
jgi:hypothetical protein